MLSTSRRGSSSQQPEAQKLEKSHLRRSGRHSLFGNGNDKNVESSFSNFWETIWTYASCPCARVQLSAGTNIVSTKALRMLEVQIIPNCGCRVLLAAGMSHFAVMYQELVYSRTNHDALLPTCRWHYLSVSHMSLFLEPKSCMKYMI